MSIPYELSGRTRQKQRTRGALVAAARELVAEGRTPTVDEAATRADPSHRGDLPLRKGRAIGWIREALSPLRGQLTERDLRRLILAIRSAAGIEAIVWLTDIGGLSRREAVQLMRWSSSALLRSALADSRAAGRQITRRRPVEGSTRRKGPSRTANLPLNVRRRAD